MEANEIQALIEQGIEGAQAIVQVDGNKCQVIVVSELFAGMRPVKKQQMVYACLNEHIQAGTIHAVSMHTWTPAEWAEQQ